MYVYREAARALGLHPDSTRVVIQGFGNVGSWAARLITQLGCKLIGASNTSGAIHCEAGIDPDALVDHLAHGGKLVEYPAADPIPPEELVSLDCEVLIPAALGGTIHAANAESIRARVVIEGANNPTTPTADEILRDKERPRRSGRAGQRRRRGRLLLRMGPEPPAPQLGRARGQQQARREDA